EFIAVPGDDEQGVVDPHGQAEHERQHRRGGHDVDRSGGRLDQQLRGRHTHQRGQQGTTAVLTERNSRNRNTSASTTPTASVALGEGTLSVNASPPRWTCAPAGSSSCRSAATASRPSRESSVTSNICTEYWATMMAVEPSSEIDPSTMPSYGEVTESICSTSENRWTAASTSSAI